MKRVFCLMGLIVLSTLQGRLVAKDLELAAIFSDHMVLQREQPVRVWGWADPEATVTCSIGDASARATADRSGKWTVELPPMKAGGPFELSVIHQEQTVTRSDVLIGEVWLCSGQSNMAMTVNRARDFEQEAAAATFPQIRMFREASAHSTEEQDRCSGSWAVCSPETVGSFSATAYFFGRDIHQQLNVPVGLVNSSVGGTSIESWTSLSAQEANEQLEPVLAEWKSKDDEFDPDTAKAIYERALAAWEKRRDDAKAAGKPIPRRPALATQPRIDRNHPSNLFNGKIRPLVGYGIRGAIWYQGENNSNRSYAGLYGEQLAALIADWRTRWGQGDFPFAWAQLPNYRAPQQQPSETSGWVLVQEQMMKTLRVPQTGMAVTIDVGEAGDIHPKDKQSVGRRLAHWALGDVYGMKDCAPHAELTMGPIYASSRVDGNRIRIRFRYAGSSLPEPDGGLKGFAIAGTDRKFQWANARIVGNEVEVWHDEISVPSAVRYSWASNPVGNLRNSAGLPASPFRTDDWTE
ncbi:MAG: sialate O-acetylesterase [Planctomycetaceae bacterium]|nr:sialate O-acetylesterase [Planctomycetaceae bacterium]